jgi:hypothetical protein
MNSWPHTWPQLPAGSGACHPDRFDQAEQRKGGHKESSPWFRSAWAISKGSAERGASMCASVALTSARTELQRSVSWYAQLWLRRYPRLYMDAVDPELKGQLPIAVLKTIQPDQCTHN